MDEIGLDPEAPAPAPPPATRDKWALIGFGVPTAIATIFGVWVDIDTWTNLSASAQGYQGLAFLAAMVFAVPAILVWMGIGALVARSRGPPGSAKRFALGSAVAMAASIIVLTVTCFASYA